MSNASNESIWQLLEENSILRPWMDTTDSMKMEVLSRKFKRHLYITKLNIDEYLRYTDHYTYYKMETIVVQYCAFNTVHSLFEDKGMKKKVCQLSTHTQGLVDLFQLECVKKNLTMLKFEDCYFGLLDMASIFGAIFSLISQLQHLQLDTVYIDNLCMDVLINGMKKGEHMSHLKSLVIKNAYIGDESATRLFNTIFMEKRCPALEYFDLSRNRVMGHGIYHLGRSITLGETPLPMTTLNLSANKDMCVWNWDTRTYQLFRAISSPLLMPNLISLDISEVHHGTVGLNAMTSALESILHSADDMAPFPSLRFLSFEKCNFDTECISSLIHMLAIGFKKLDTLVLSFNPINQDGCDVLINFLHAGGLPNLRRLCLKQLMLHNSPSGIKYIGQRLVELLIHHRKKLSVIEM